MIVPWRGRGLRGGRVAGGDRPPRRPSASPLGRPVRRNTSISVWDCCCWIPNYCTGSTGGSPGSGWIVWGPALFVGRGARGAFARWGRGRARGERGRAGCGPRELPLPLREQAERLLAATADLDPSQPRVQSEAVGHGLRPRRGHLESALVGLRYLLQTGRG